MSATAALRRYTAILAENRSVLVVCVATTISMTGQGIVAPVLPIFAKEFGVGAAAVGLVVGIFGLARLFLNLPAGILSQRFGWRALMTGGLFLGGVGTGLMGISNGIFQLAMWRFLAGAGSALFLTGAMAYISDISTTENRGRLMSLQQGSLLIGVDIGPAMGGFIADALDFRWPFYLAGMLGGVAALWVFLYLPAPRPSRTDPALQRDQTPREDGNGMWDLQAIKTMLSNPTFLLVGVFTLLVFFTRTGSRQTLLPLIAVERLDISVTQLGLLYTAMTTVNLLLVVPVGAMTDRFGRKAVLMPGTALTLLGLTLFAFGGNLLVFYIAAFVLGMGTGVIGPAPAAYAGDLAPPGRSGVAMGLYRTFGDVGFVAGPVALGFVADLADGMFGDVLGLSVSMELNAALLAICAIAVLVAAKETAGHRSSSRPVQYRE
ncbi:MAG: MFS transporter [Chloroflexi bacterium]|nr:MFS transporter [Chloroflexota bacterium]